MINDIKSNATLATALSAIEQAAGVVTTAPLDHSKAYGGAFFISVLSAIVGVISVELQASEDGVVWTADPMESNNDSLVEISQAGDTTIGVSSPTARYSRLQITTIEQTSSVVVGVLAPLRSFRG